MLAIIVSTTKDWFDYLRDILTMAGCLATFGAFLYLFRRDNDKQRQIDALALIAVQGEENLKLSVLPDLYKNGAQTRPADGNILIDLLNRGENARLIEFNSQSPDIELHSKSLPWVLQKGEERKIIARTTGKNPNDCEYIISVIYEDKLKNVYQIDISGVGSQVQFGEAFLLKNRNT